VGCVAAVGCVAVRFSRYRENCRSRAGGRTPCRWARVLSVAKGKQPGIGARFTLLPGYTFLGALMVDPAGRVFALSVEQLIDAVLGVVRGQPVTVFAQAGCYGDVG